MIKKLKMFGALMLAGMGSVFAQSSPIVELPATFADDAKLTLTTAFGVILSVLVIVWVIRKLTKTVNRS